MPVTYRNASTDGDGFRLGGYPRRILHCLVTKFRYLEICGHFRLDPCFNLRAEQFRGISVGGMAPIPWGSGGPDLHKIWMWGLMWLEPHENFTKMNVMSAQSTSGAVFNTYNTF